MDNKNNSNIAVINKPWAIETNLTMATLKTSKNGLTTHEAAKRLKIYGFNSLAEKKRGTFLSMFFSRFTSPLILILLGAAIISYFLGDSLDAGIIFFMIITSVLIDFIQRYKAETAAIKLKQKVSLTATVLRDAVKKEIPLSHLVPGDVVYLSAGDLVPADCRVIEANYLFVNQASLTGESFPVNKKADLLNDNAAELNKQNNCVFLGTTVVSGSGMGVVFATGKTTYLGKISLQLTTKRPATEFEKGILQFSYLILKVTFVLVLVIFLFHGIFKQNILQSFLFAVALAVGLTPEMLPMMIAINLARGAIRMSKQGVIVKDLAAIENFGSMDVLCMDKTGTLTEGKIRLEKYENVHGVEDRQVLLYAYLNSYFDAGLKSPLDDAILNHGDLDISGYSKIDEVPFDFVRKRLSVILKQNNKYLLISKGAVEGEIEECHNYIDHGKILPLNREIKQKIMQRLDKLSQDGFRVLAVGFKEVKKAADYTPIAESDMVFLGLIAFYDPPKTGVQMSLQKLIKLGIRTKILTGDNEMVTQKICRDLGLNIEKNQIVISSQLTKLNETESEKVIKEGIIFARLSPDEKQRVITILKKQGNVVGYLGDGINDAPSLKSADIGISVNNAVDVAKETADFILLHKSLHMLADGVYEGRKTFANVMKYILMGTSSNFGNMFSVAGASIFLPFLPMLPKQILLNNFLYDSSQLTLAADNIDEEYIAKPRKWNISYIKKYMLIFGSISSIFDFMTYFIMLGIFRASVPLFQTAWFTESLISQTLVILSIRTRRLPFFKSKISWIFLINIILVIILTLLLPQIAKFRDIFGFVSPPIVFYLILLEMMVLYLILVELAKSWFFRKYNL